MKKAALFFDIDGEIMEELLSKWEEMGYTFRPLSDLTKAA